MAPDDEGDDDVAPAGPPLPPADRLWRHPSELRDHGVGGGAAPAVPPALPPPASPGRPTGSTQVLVAGLVGAALATAVIAATGSFSQGVVERAVVEKVAVTPVASSPMLSNPRDIVAVTERLSPSIVRLDVLRDGGITTGSGVIFRDDGMLLTSAHVVAGAASISAVLADGRRVDGTTVGLDTATDVAVVDLEGDGFPVALLGTAEGLAPGVTAIAISSPLDPDGGPSVTTGVVSAVGRRVEALDGESLHGMIQTDAPMAEGSSGGALVDTSGALIGITSAVAPDAGERFGFATPIDLAHRVADQLIATGHMVHGWLGVEGADLPADRAGAAGLPGGALVHGVAGQSPAAAAGLAAGDVIVGVDDRTVSSISSLVVQLRAHAPGDHVSLRYWRDGTVREATAVLAERPSR